MIELSSKLPESPEAIEGDSGTEEQPVEMIELFSIDGKAYSVPNEPRPMVSLRYLMVARNQGVGVAESWLGEELLGREAYSALLDCPTITVEQHQAVLDAARKIAYGEVVPKAKGSMNGGAKSPTTTPRVKNARNKSKPVNGL